MGDQNEQESLRSRNDRQIWNVLSKQIIGKAKAVPEPTADTVSMNKADTNDDTCFLGTNFILLVYTNRSTDLYIYNNAYKPIKNVPIASGATACDYLNGTINILVFH